MARTTPPPRLTGPRAPDRGPGYSTPWAHVPLSILGSLVGLGMFALVHRKVAELGAQAPVVHDLLALQGSGAGSPDFRAAATDTGSQLLSFTALALATGAVATLLAGAWLAVGGRSRRRAGHRLITIGFWLALVVSMAALLPIDGQPFALGWAMEPIGEGPTAIPWHPFMRGLAIAAGAGLLLASIAAKSLEPPRRAASA